MTQITVKRRVSLGFIVILATLVGREYSRLGILPFPSQISSSFFDFPSNSIVGKYQNHVSMSQPPNNTVPHQRLSPSSQATNGTNSDSMPQTTQSTTPAKFRTEVGWWTPLLEETARTFHSPYDNRMEKYAWCIPMNQSEFPITPSKKILPVSGLLYVKSYKASSSTCQGVNAAIAHHVGRRIASAALTETTTQIGTGEETTGKNNVLDAATTKCLHYDRHEFADDKFHGLRDPNKSLLWSFVRHPRSRDISQIFFFRVSRQRISPNDTTVLLDALERQRSTQSRYLSVKGKGLWGTNDLKVQDVHKHLSTVLKEQIFQTFDFIGVTERMYESLAVMTLLWDLDPTDVIVLSAKQSGNEDSYDAGGKRQQCTKLVKPILHPVLADYLQSPEYLEGNADYLLYYAANLSLDWTIQSLGIQRVQDRVTLLTQLQQLAQQICYEKAIFPCSKDGVYQMALSQQNCYIHDAGCGYQCVDEVMEDYRRGKVQLS